MEPPGSLGEVRPERPERRATGAGPLSRLLEAVCAWSEPEAPGNAVPLLPGASVGRFEILHELGRGGFGVVYKARDRELGRLVAVKVLRPARAADRSRRSALLRSEAEVAAQLAHESIVTLFDAGTCDRGPFLVMELLDGETLAERLARGALPASEALAALIDVAEALAHAHAAGVVHRDLKPSNVFLTRGGRAKVLDFGLARALGRSTVEGGTPAYMAPEQARGEPEDERTDLFALGVMLREMLTGHRPSSKDRAEIPAPGAPALPAALAAVVDALAAADPGLRPASARDALLALREAARSTGNSPPRPAPFSVARSGAGALPRSFTPLVGREREVREVLDALASSPLVTLTGAGGTGKTRVAIAAAEAFPRERAPRVAFVDLAALSDPGLVPQAAAAALQVRDVPDGLAVTGALVSALGDEPVLLVLDNCEHMVEPCAAFAADVTRGCRGARILATSQIPLGIAGEVVHRILPLAAPPEASAPPAGDVAAWRRSFPALELLAQRLSATDPDFVLTADEAPRAAEICRRLDGLPLALELVAPRSQVLSLSEIADQLAHRFALLSQGDRSLPARQRGLAAVLEWSYGLLSGTERRALERLAVFAGTFSYEAAAAVCATLPAPPGGFVDLLQGLVDRSLVMAQRARPGERRFRLLETVRLYAADRLDAGGDGDEARTHLVAWALALAEDPRRPSRRWSERVGVEWDNLRVAFEASQRLPDRAEDGLRLAAGLWTHWFGYGRGETLEYAGWLERALASAPRAAAPSRAEALLALALLNLPAQDATGFGRPARAALELVPGLGDERLAALARCELTWLHLFEGRIDDALRSAEEGVEAGRQAGAEFELGLCLHARGICSALRGDRAGALASLREGVAILGDESPLQLRMYLRLNLALQAYLAGEPDEGRLRLREGIDLCLALSIRRGLGGCIEAAAYVASDRGSAAHAARLLGAAEHIRLETRSPLYPHWKAPHAAAEARVRERLGASFDGEKRAGATLPLAEAAELAREALS